MNKVKLIVAAIGILLFFAGCDKYHRNRYVGDWDFVTERIFYNKDTNSEYYIIEQERDTVYYSGKIKLGSAENRIIIKYTENDEVNTWLRISDDKRAFIHNEEAGDMLGKYPSGEFENKNKMYLNLQWGRYCVYDGHYDFRHDIIVGTKKGRSGK
jgi:hypothetical protein